MNRKQLQERVYFLEGQLLEKEMETARLQMHLHHKEISIRGLIREADELRNQVNEKDHVLRKLASIFSRPAKKCATHCNWPRCDRAGCVRKLHLPVIPPI